MKEITNYTCFVATNQLMFNNATLDFFLYPSHIDTIPYRIALDIMTLILSNQEYSKQNIITMMLSYIEMCERKMSKIIKCVSEAHRKMWLFLSLAFVLGFVYMETWAITNNTRLLLRLADLFRRHDAHSHSKHTWNELCVHFAFCRLPAWFYRLRLFPSVAAPFLRTLGLYNWYLTFTIYTHKMNQFHWASSIALESV